MASSYAPSNDPDRDPLYLLRTSIQTSRMPTLSATTDTQTPSPPLESATYAIFTHPSKVAIPLDAPTRWIARKDSAPFDLRSIIFAFECKELTIPDYVSACQSLGDGKRVKNLGFLERTDLITWLTGAQKESDFLRPIENEVAGGAGAAAQQKQDAGAKGAVGAQAGVMGQGRPRPELNPELEAVYLREREIGNRNSVLRGIKPTDFSHVRKIGEDFVKRLRASQKPGGGAPVPTSGRPADPRAGTVAQSGVPRSLVPGKPPAPSGSKRVPTNPIILLSPSTSALLRMSNIKDFLESGTYNVPSTSTASGPNMLDISRLLPSINPNSSMTFRVYDSTDLFKPDYWNRVVAVFTTGQLWQFKSYKWSTPQELFAHVKGFYVGWVEEGIPDTVARWGNVQMVGVEKNRRFRDREVMEGFWEGVEKWMVAKGWGASRRQY